MPGPIVHLIVQQRLVEALQRQDVEGSSALAEILLEDRCCPYAGFGSMGPDFLFFSTREYGNVIGDLTNFIFGVYDALEPFITFYENTVKPIEDAIDAVTTFIDETFFNGLFGDLQATADTLIQGALLAVANVFTQNIDLFHLFFPKSQLGQPESEWYWFDFLHYRRTGRFCSTLWRLANDADDNDLRRYTLGYASHIGTDVIGHPFVNSIVGGPFRMHWRRHKLVENWIDAYARNHYDDPAWLINCLGLGGDDIYQANSISGSYYSRLCEFSGKKMPDKLGEMLVRAIDLTYTDMVDAQGNRLYPPLFSVADFDSTYRLWLKWFERATAIGSARRPTPVPPPGAAASALVQDFVSGFPSFPGGGGSSGGGFSLAAFFEAVWNFLKWLAESIAYTMTWIITHLPQIVLLPITEALALLKWLVNQAHQGIYNWYDNLRFALVMGGYLFPEEDDLKRVMTNNLLWSNAFTNTAFAHTTGGGVAQFGYYPHRRDRGTLLGTVNHHLTYPTTLRERWYAEPMPVPMYGVFPETFIDGGFPFDPMIRDLYACKQPYGGNASATHFIDQNTWWTPQFGSALHFSARLIGERLDDLPNFNLDGDRGYGWKTWRALDPRGIEPGGDDLADIELGLTPRTDLVDPNYPATDVDYIDA